MINADKLSAELGYLSNEIMGYSVRFAKIEKELQRISDKIDNRSTKRESIEEGRDWDERLRLISSALYHLVPVEQELVEAAYDLEEAAPNK